MSREREGLLRLYGARVEITESMGGMNEAVDAARAMAARDDVFLPDQFSNPANPEVHRRTTGPGDPRRARRPRRRARRRRRDRRHDHRRRARSSRRATRGCRVVAVEPAASRRALGPRAGPAQDPGHRRGLRARRCSTARSSTRSSRSATRRRSRPRASPRARGRARRHLVRRGAVGAIEVGAPARVARQADRRRAARLRRALRLDAVLRAGVEPAGRATRGCPGTHASSSGHGPKPASGLTCPAPGSEVDRRCPSGSRPACAPRRPGSTRVVVGARPRRASRRRRRRPASRSAPRGIEAASSSGDAGDRARRARRAGRGRRGSSAASVRASRSHSTQPSEWQTTTRSSSPAPSARARACSAAPQRSGHGASRSGSVG